MPFEFIILLLINAFWILGFNRACSYELEDICRYDDDLKPEQGIVPGSKNILWFVAYYGEKYLPWYLQKPLYDCPKCMGSLHSIYPYFIVYGFSLESLLLWPLYVISLSGLASFIDNHG